MGESVEKSMEMEPELWIPQEMFLRGCRAITKLVLLGVQSGVVLMDHYYYIKLLPHPIASGDAEEGKGRSPEDVHPVWPVKCGEPMGTS